MYTENERIMEFDLTDEYQKHTELSVWIRIRRYVGAFFIFAIYWITLWGSIRNGLILGLFSNETKKLIEDGIIDSPFEYGWGEHYIWFLIVISFVTFCAAALAGATAKRKGMIIASIANIPFVIGFIYICYSHFTGSKFGESIVAWNIVLPISVAGSILFAFWGGEAGRSTQEEGFDDSTILGIRPRHWFWLWIVSGAYLMGFAATVTRYLAYINYTDTLSIFSAVPLFLVFVPCLGFGVPMSLLYGILSGGLLEEKNITIKIISFIGIFVVGLIAGYGLDWLCMKILLWLAHIFS